MTPILNLSFEMGSWAIGFVLISSLKISLVLLAAFGSMTLLRRSSAALRHWVWSLALSAAILIPVFSLISPAWSVPVLPQGTPWETPPGFTSITSAPVRPDKSYAQVSPSAAGSGDSAGVVNPSNDNPPASAVPTVAAPVKTTPTSILGVPAAFNWSWLALLGWFAGVIVVMLYWLRQLAQIWRITRRGFAITDTDWQQELNTLARLVGVRRPVRLVITDEVAVPMTWGLWSPVILLPVSALSWNWAPMRRRVVLLHELAHIARLDYLTQWIALIGCALNWFNPLVWRAARKSFTEREQASDDRVLNTGVWGADYATHLLDIARAAIRRSPYRAVGLAMAQRSDLSQRIHGILNPHKSRHPLTRRRYVTLFLLVAVVLLPLSSMQLSRAVAQDNSIVITLSFPGKAEDLISNAITRDFEPAHPGVKVKFVDTVDLPDATDGLDAHFAALQKYASSADVLYVSGYRLGVTPHATRAGYFLDLSPLIKSDASYNADDLFPQMASMYQWDNGIWGLPFNADLVLLNYDKAAFDKAGVAYPDGKWTLEDFVNAVTKLTVKDSDGHITAGGFANSGRIFRESFWRSLINANLVDDSVIPNAPKLDTPAIEAVIDAYHQLEQKGLITSNTDTAAMLVTNFRARDFGQNNRGWALLPGNKSVLLPDAFSVSAGTQHPDLAYELVKFLTSRPELSGPIPLRKSVAAQNGDPKSQFSAEVQDLVSQALANSLNYADLRFSDYLNAAHFDTTKSTQDSLQAVEVQAVSDLRIADSKKGTLVLAITEPVAPSLPAGKIALKFDLTTNFPVLPTKDQWDKVIQDFTASDPEVGLIDLRVGRDFPAVAATKSDCFYTTTNAVPSLGANAVLNLDPFLDADPSYDKNDFAPGVLPSVQRDNKTYALPIDIQPLILRYDTNRFSAAGLPAPTNDWTVEKFVDALRALKPTSDGQAPFVENNSDGTYLLLLIAAYGGLPIDFRTSPPTINFADPATETAIQQVLDLAKNNLIRYAAIGSLPNRPDIYPNQTTAIYPSTLDGFAATQKVLGVDPNMPVMFPVGHQYTGLAYDIGTAYISAGAQNPEACYRFLSTIAKHPELFPTMPARHSLLASAGVKTSTTPEALALYNRVDALLNDPKTVPFPMPQRGTGSVSMFLVEHWLFEAFDTYVLNGGDLNTALQNGDSYAKAFTTCIASLPTLTLDAADSADHNLLRAYADCAEKADSRLKPILEPLVGQG